MYLCMYTHGKKNNEEIIRTVYRYMYMDLERLMWREREGREGEAEGGRKGKEEREGRKKRKSGRGGRKS